jgi:hypothetical protein
MLLLIDEIFLEKCTLFEIILSNLELLLFTCLPKILIFCFRETSLYQWRILRVSAACVRGFCCRRRAHQAGIGGGATPHSDSRRRHKKSPPRQKLKGASLSLFRHRSIIRFCKSHYKCTQPPMVRAINSYI